MPRRSCRGFSARRAPWAVPRLSFLDEMPAVVPAASHAAPKAQLISRRNAPAPPACAGSLACGASGTALQNQNRERTTQRGTLEMGQGCSLGREARRTVPCGSILLCTPCETLRKGAAPPAMEGASVEYLSPKRQHVPSQTCVCLRSAAWRACSPDVDG
jgi:hypothetical protein